MFVINKFPLEFSWDGVANIVNSALATIFSASIIFVIFKIIYNKPYPYLRCYIKSSKISPAKNIPVVYKTVIIFKLMNYSSSDMHHLCVYFPRSKVKKKFKMKDVENSSLEGFGHIQFSYEFITKTDYLSDKRSEITNSLKKEFEDFKIKLYFENENHIPFWRKMSVKWLDWDRLINPEDYYDVKD